MKQKFQEDLQNIQNLQKVSAEIKRFIGELKKVSEIKNTPKQPAASTVNYYNANIGVLGDNHGVVNVQSATPKRKRNKSAKEQTNEPTTHSLVLPSSDYKINPSLRSLYEYV